MLTPGTDSVLSYARRMDRRQFLTAGAAAASLLAVADLATNPLDSTPAFAWPNHCIAALPKSPIKRMAWTLDDGYSQTALAAYVKLLEKHEDLTMTMFVLSHAPSWKNLAKPISALVETGRVQMANHTVTHRSLTSLSAAAIKRELMGCSRFIEDTFNVSPGTYFRPPYGNIDDRVVRVAADIGYTTPVLWYGSTGSGSTSSSAGVWRQCQKWMGNGRIVIDHANSNATVNNFDRIRALLAQRGLQTVTIKDAFGHH